MGFKLTKRRLAEIAACMTGSKYGLWTVIRLSKVRDGICYWWCRCNCGLEKEVNGGSLTSNTNPSEGCSSCRTPSKSGSGWSHLWRGIKSNAKTRNFEFSVTEDYVIGLMDGQAGLCALSGLPLTVSEYHQNKGKVNTRTASLDRIDSNKGYVIGNVQWVHKDINRMKMNLDESYFFHLCRTIVNFQNKES